MGQRLHFWKHIQYFKMYLTYLQGFRWIEVEIVVFLEFNSFVLEDLTICISLKQMHSSISNKIVHWIISILSIQSYPPNPIHPILSIQLYQSNPIHSILSIHSIQSIHEPILPMNHIIPLNPIHPILSIQPFTNFNIQATLWILWNMQYKMWNMLYAIWCMQHWFIQYVIHLLNVLHHQLHHELHHELRHELHQVFNQVLHTKITSSYA
jgi:hypothetical protein